MQKENHNQHHPKGHEHHYRKFLIMIILSFIVMYVLMYAMVNSISNVYPNSNQFYMAGLMATAMVIIEIAVMWTMYKNKKLNLLILALSIVALGAFWIGIRQQVAVSDKQFLKAMIPHHAGAILMCENADLKDPEIRKLCEQIRSGQQAEIDFMKAKLKELKSK